MDALSGAEQKRIKEADLQQRSWKRWGPYLSERQWGTVREDYSSREIAGLISPII